MEIVKPSEISGKIMSLIEDANEFVVVVSPYYKVSRWEKLMKRIDGAKRRGVEFTFYTRMPECRDDDECINEVKRIGFTPIEIERLHAKIYLNEGEAIISSMNLSQSSDTGSLDIALKTQTPQEYKDVFNFYEKYISKKSVLSNLSKAYSIEHFVDELDKRVMNVFKREAQIEYDEYGITINGKNLYQVFISYEKECSLRLSCVLSGKEFDYLQHNTKLFKRNRLHIEVQEGFGKHYNLIWGTLSSINSESFKKLEQAEANDFLDIIIGFMEAVEQMKDLVRNEKNKKLF